MKIYTIDHFLEKFAAIPEDQFIDNHFNSPRGSCYLGHCGETPESITNEGTSLKTLLASKTGWGPVSINTDRENKFPGDTIKGRILAVLDAIKKYDTPSLKNKSWVAN